MMIFSSWACANATNRTGIRRADQRTRTMTHLRNAGTGERAAAAHRAAGLPTVSAAGHASAVCPGEQILYSPRKPATDSKQAISTQQSAFSPCTFAALAIIRENPRAREVAS